MGMNFTNGQSIGVLTNNARYSIFRCGDISIKFKTSPYLEYYSSIQKWDHGYIECMAKYSTLKEPVEEYIDLAFIANRLRLPNDFFDRIKEVRIA